MARAEIVHTYPDDMLATRVCRMYCDVVLTEEDQEP